MGAAETSTGTGQGRGREGVLAGADGLDFSQGRWARGKGEAQMAAAARLRRGWSRDMA